MSERKLAVAGQFYPNNSDEVLRYINHFNNTLDVNVFAIEQNQNLMKLQIKF